MIKNLLFLAALLVVASIGTVNAQTDFKLKQTAYIGALSADQTQDWTQTGWTNFDPKNATYGAPTDTVTLNGMITTLANIGLKDITGTVTLAANQVYLLKGLVVVRSGAKLVIPAGTVIRCSADGNVSPVKNYGTLVVERGGKIEITGTAASPVVFTSAKAVGSRERGDWGGLVLCGRSIHNLWSAIDTTQYEGFNGIAFDRGIAKLGGTDVNDNSGIVRYCRFEFGGFAFEPNKEVNGLTLGSVGAATEVKYVQVSFSGDDSFEWFGGTVNSSYLIAYKGTDDDFDTDNGYRGLSQFGIGVRDSAYFDLTYNVQGGSTSEGFESDGEPVGTLNTTQYTSCVFSNYTMVGPIPVGGNFAAASNATKTAFRRGARIRRNSSQRIVNTIFMGYRNFLMVEGDSVLRNTNNAGLAALVSPTYPINVAAKQLSFSNNVIVNTTTAFAPSLPADTLANGLVEVSVANATSIGASIPKLNAADAWLRQTGLLANKINPVAFTAGTLLVNPSAYTTTPNFRPVAGSPAGSGANFLDNPVLNNLINVGTKDIEAAAVAPVFPNPVVAGVLNFGREVVSYGIFDVTGRLVASGLSTDHANVSFLSKGIYFVKLDGKVQKFVVQ